MIGAITAGLFGTGAAAGGGASYDSIATSTPSGTGTVTFSSIPSTYKHLQLRILARYSSSITSGNIRMQYNSDTSANYATHYLEGDGASTGAGAYSSITYNYMVNVIGGSSTANAFWTSVVDILDYQNTNKYKTTRWLQGYDANGSGFVEFQSSLWQSTSAINSISFSNGGGWVFAAGTSFALYGIKG
jgi:hypothetical protein